MSSKNLLLAAAVAATGMLALATLARADTTMDPALAKLETMVTNLGYTTTDAADKSHFRFDYQGQYDYTIDFQMSDDGTLIYGYIYLETYDAGDLAKAPYIKMLSFQNNGNVYFSFQSNGDKQDIYTNTVFGAAGLTPALLRSDIDYLVQRTDDSDDLWDQKLWK